MAVAHQLITIIFHIVRGGGVFNELGANHYDQQNKPKITRKLIERLQKFGYYVTLQPIEAPPPSDPVSVTVVDPKPTERRKRGRPCKCRERGIPCSHRPCGELANKSPNIGNDLRGPAKLIS